MFSRICRAYPAYDLQKVGDLTVKQIRALMRNYNKEPWFYTVMVEPGDLD